MTLNDLYYKYIEFFKEKGISDLALRIVLCHIYHYDNMTQFEFNRDKEIALSKKDENLINKVLAGVPVQYVIHSAHFYNMDFYVNSFVLIPRPETEELVFETIKRINTKFVNFEKDINIVDLGSGSGNISIALDKTLQIPDNVYGIDNSIKALLVAKYNGITLKSKAKFKFGNILKLKTYPFKKVNVIISNPPYISNEDEIEKNVKDYEPYHALIARPETLFYEKIFENCKHFLDEKFLLCFEIGYDMKDKLEKILSNDFFYRNYSKYEFKKDMEGKDRFLFIESL
jgi:release factor glutamine methyltransferase